MNSARDHHILVVDDDATQGRALGEAFTRAGYRVTLTRSSAEALQTASRQEFHALIVDVMLPKMNGVVLVEKINALAVRPPLTILYSGVFKDKTFHREALARTGASAFLTKPFPLDELLDLVDGHFRATRASVDDPLLTLYGSGALSDEAMAEILRAAPTVPGIHLPMIYRRLQAAGATGDLAMVTATGDLNTVSFDQGRIFSVHTPDQGSPFGAVSISLGLASAEDLEEALNNPGNKRIGQKLIEAVAMSPHALDLVMQEQLALRLSQTIEDGAHTLSWTPREFPPAESVLSLERFHLLADDWTRSKIDAAWVRDYLMAWGDYNLEGPAHASLSVRTIEDLLSAPQIDDDRDLTHLMRQLINGHVTIGVRSAAQDYRFLETRLTHLLQIYPAQNYFEVLGIGEKAHSLEINRAYEDLRRSFDPANLGEDCPPRIVLKATKVFQFITAAHDTLGDEIARQRYVLLQMNKRGQTTLENEPLFRQAINLVTSGRAAEAGEIFQDLIERKLQFPNLRAYRIWAGFAAEHRFKNFDFDKIAPEERHSVAYHMARGLYFKSRGELARAAESFTAALVMDDRLAAARAELIAVQKASASRTTRTFIGDLTTSIGNKIRRGA